MRMNNPTLRALGALTIALAISMAPAAAANAQSAQRALWLRAAAISPDGKTVAFSYRGDLWRVSSSGGAATPITVHADYDTSPVWSPDGTQIAFASDRYGNFDVFVMPSTGGEATRLTFHSADDTPTSFTPDGSGVLFSSATLDSATNVQFPTGAQPELYRVDLKGSMPVRVLTTPALYAAWDKGGNRLAYSDQKGYEMEWRKHDNSSFARDVWVWDRAANRHQRLTGFGVDDRQPVWAADDKSLYYLSERSGSFNVWKLDLADPEHPTQITDHKTHPVRFLSIAYVGEHSGDVAYTYDGEIYVRPAGAKESRRLDVTTSADRRDLAQLPVDVSSEIREFDVSPNGKEIAFSARGEVFVSSIEYGATRRITNTPGQERSVSFSPDGKSILYAGERDGSWNLYKTERTDPDEPAFFNASALKESTVLATAAEEFQPQYSPDGKEIAYLDERTTLKVLDPATGKTRVVLPGDLNYSYSDGDQWYEWSPDGKTIAVQFLSPSRWSSEVGIVNADGSGTVKNISRSGYEDERPHWARKGEVLMWFSDRLGARQQAGWPREQDVFAAFLTEKAWDRYKLDEASYAQLSDKEKDEEKPKDKDKEDADEDKTKNETEKELEAKKADKVKVKLPPPVALQLEGIEDRIARVSMHSADLAGAGVTPDGEMLVYLAKFEKTYDLWKYEPRKQKVELLAKLDAEESAALRLDREGKNAIVLADDHVMKVDLESGKTKPIKISAKLELRPSAEREALFEHAWRQTQKKFYVESMHGVDWPAMRSAYAKFLPYIDNDRDLAELISEMQGELNASHTGGRYRPKREGGDATASLAFFPDPSWNGDGVRILEIIEKSPLRKGGSKVHNGAIITAIDGESIAAGTNWYPLLNRKADTPVRLSLLDPATNSRWEESVKPITWDEQSRLLYERWVRTRRATVEKLSNGRLGYAHIRGMNDGAYREVFDETFGRAVNKDAVVLDTRFNGGGNLVEALTVFLSGQVYYKSTPRGRQIGVEPGMRWTKPSIVVMNEGNYSDAHCFPTAYKQLKLGETVGMQVPGTCTSVWWERMQNRNLTFGIPEVGYIDMNGKLTENQHLNPDYEVDNDPALEASGRDQQLEKAVEVMLGKLDRK